LIASRKEAPRLLLAARLLSTAPTARLLPTAQFLIGARERKARAGSPSPAPWRKQITIGTRRP
jgi:hypothetical protein